MTEKTNSSETLPFSNIKQLSFFNHIIKNRSYYHQVKSQIKKNWFVDPIVGEAYGLYIKWSAKYDPQNEKLPSVLEIQNSNEFIELPVEKQIKIKAAIAAAGATTDQFDWDALVSELSAWLKCRIYLENVTKSTDFFNNKKFNEAFQILETSVKQYQEVKFFQDDSVDFLDWRNHFSKSENERLTGLTTGLKILDQKIDPACTNGCLLPGDTTIVLAPVNVGKSSFMINIAVANLFLGKTILFITHEGRKEDITDKFWCCVTGKTKGELLKLYKTDEELFKGASYFINENLVYCPINNPEHMTIEHVAAIIEKKQQERIAKHGRGFDCIFDDYPSKLTTAYSSRVSMQLRQSEAYVYNTFVQLALKHNFHAVLAVQTNREGSKINKFQGEHGTENRLLTIEDVSESFGIMMVATTVLSLNRNSKNPDKLTVHLCKSRSSEVGHSILCKADYSRSRTHGFGMPAVAYKGGASLSHMTSEVLAQYNNNSLPIDVQAELEKDL